MRARASLAVLSAVLAVSAANASAEVCSITSVVGVAFGAYDVFDPAPVSTSGSVSFECSGVQPSDRVVIQIDGAEDAATLRTMTTAGHTLAYQLYLDAARTLVWGAGGGGTVTYGPTLPTEGVPTVVPIYGELPARQQVGPGSYAASVVVTLQF